MPFSSPSGRGSPGLTSHLQPINPARTGYCALVAGKVCADVAVNFLNPQTLQPGAAIQLLLEQFNLTPRQAEVLHWIAEGKTNQEISMIMECSFFTVKNHIKEIYLRLCVNSRVAAAAFTYRAIVANQLAESAKAKPKPKSRAVKQATGGRAKMTKPQ